MKNQIQKHLVPPQNIKIGKYLILMPIIIIFVLAMINAVITYKYSMGGLPSTAPPQYTQTETIVLDIIASFSLIFFAAILIWIPIGIYYVRKKKVLNPEKRSERNKKLAKTILTVSLLFFIIMTIISAITSYPTDLYSDSIQGLISIVKIITSISVAVCIPLAIHYYRKEMKNNN